MRYRYRCGNGHDLEIEWPMCKELPRECGFIKPLAEPSPACGAPVEYEIAKPGVIWRGDSPTPKFSKRQ